LNGSVEDRAVAPAKARWSIEGSLRAPAILIVDDFPPMLKILRSQLAEIGLTDVDAAGGARQALTALDHRDYDLLIVDHYLGDSTGQEILQSLAARHRDGETPSIIITGEPERAARDIGAMLDWLRKPFTAQQLRRRIESTCPHWQLTVA
jgi:DNA-binding response OmpR family regulator